MAARYAAVLFDLLTGLLDSWSLWDAVAYDEGIGRRWRTAYLRRMYLVGRYRPYQELVAEAARDQDLDPALAGQLVARWDELRPWPEAVAVLTDLAGSVPLGVVTNCSNELGRRAAERVGVPFDVVVTAERAGAHKPRPEPYHYALEELAVAPEACCSSRVRRTTSSVRERPECPCGGITASTWTGALRRRRSLSMTRSGRSRLRCWADPPDNR